MKYFLVLAAAIASLSATPARAQDAAAGETVFKRQCGMCHAVVPGKNMIGPSLSGIIGRKAGTVPNFRYSAANRDSGITWDAAQLEPYLTSPKAVIPGTTMVYVGQKDAQQRADLIAYLQTLK